MTFTTEDKTRKAVEQFRGFDADTQLGLLWYGYLDIKESLTPVNQDSAQQTAKALFDRPLAKVFCGRIVDCVILIDV
ncbi:MAG: orange carotenoid protein N-terminal domain-containing protein [Rivularia sp. (in: cyanobacteria)]